MKSYLATAAATAALVLLVVASGASAVTARSAVAPSSNSAPSIGGKAAVGSTVTANPGTWNGSTPMTFQYQWLICGGYGHHCHDISGATGKTYTIRSGDQGNTLRVHVIASNSDGSSSATSNASAKIGTAAVPAETQPPTISGEAKVDSSLTASSGSWSGPQPIHFAYQWEICDGDGNNCHDISGQTSATYTVRAEDPGNTIRVRVTASNSSGSASSTSAPTAKVAASSTPAPGAGCPKLPAGAQAASVGDVAAPARLQIAQFVGSGPITAHMSSFTVRFRITDTCGQPVAGAAVYATAVPYNQVTVPPEALTDGSGWASLQFNRLSAFPTTRRQELMVLFVRARQPGGNTLAGISTRRLISLPVELGR